MSFADLKKNAKGNSDRLSKELEKLTQKQNFDDDRFWYPKRDKAGNAFAVIRFLPASAGEDIPWIRYFHHGFEHNGKWFIENCPTTLGRDCPLCAKNSELWNTGLDSNKDIVRQRKRKLTYVANILVLKDADNPENEGMVRLFKFGKKIFDKIENIMNPEEKFGDAPVNPFDFWTGADFKLKVRQYEGYANYDKSEFDKPSALLGGNDKELEKIYNQQYKLGEFIAPDKFKSEEELTKRLAFVLGSSPKATQNDTNTPAEQLETAGVPSEDGMDYFKRLAAED